MLEIGERWKDWIGYSEFGTAYFGINSIPIKVDENIYQVKCLCSNHCNHSEYGMKYLQFDLSTTNVTLDFLNGLQNNYIKEMNFCGYFTNNPNVYIVGKCEKPKNIAPCSYNAKKIHSLFLRLSKLKIQDKPILK